MSIGFGDWVVGGPRVRRAAQASLSYCAQQVRAHDPERYLATLFAPAAAREALFALYAFDHEIARVRHVVSEPLAGLVRFQWWRDALDAPEPGDLGGYPVAAALRTHRARFAPLRPRLHAAIDARELELTADPPADLAELEGRLEASCATITLIAVDLLGAGGVATHAAARHLGLALGLVRLLQSVPSDLRRDRLRLPTSLIGGQPADPDHPGAAPDGRALAPAVATLAGRARDHLRHARRHRRQVPTRALAAFLHARLLDHYLRRLARAGYDRLADADTRAGPWAPLELLGQRALRRY